MIVKGAYGEYVVKGIYQHYKGNFYMIDAIAFLHDTQNVYLVIYHQCDINGMYVSIRNDDGSPKVHQPFATHETRWNDQINGTTRFKLIK